MLNGHRLLQPIKDYECTRVGRPGTHTHKTSKTTCAYTRQNSELTHSSVDEVSTCFYCSSTSLNKLLNLSFLDLSCKKRQKRTCSSFFHPPCASHHSSWLLVSLGQLRSQLQMLKGATPLPAYQVVEKNRHLIAQFVHVSFDDSTANSGNSGI